MKETIKINKSNDVRIVRTEIGFISIEPGDIYYCSYKVQIKILGFIWITVKEYWYGFRYAGPSTDINWKNTDDYNRICADDLYEHLIKNE